MRSALASIWLAVTANSMPTSLMAYGNADHNAAQTIRLNEPEPFSGLNHFTVSIAPQFPINIAQPTDRSRREPRRPGSVAAPCFGSGAERTPPNLGVELPPHKARRFSVFGLSFAFIGAISFRDLDIHTIIPI